MATQCEEGLVEVFAGHALEIWTFVDNHNPLSHCKRIFSSVMGPDLASKSHLTPLGKWNEEAMNSLCQPGKMVRAWAGTGTVATGKEGLMRDAWQR